MGTNGVLITDRVAEKMVACGVKGVGISIDSLDPAKHNSFRGGPDAWEYSVKALDICRAHGLEVLVQTTIMDMNYAEVPRLIEFARQKGAWSFNLYFLVQTGRGQEMNDLSAEGTEEMLSYLVGVQDQHKPMLVRSKCAPHFKRISYERGLGGLESGGCMAGSEYCRITPEGNVTPCPYMTVVAGKELYRDLGILCGFAPTSRREESQGTLRRLRVQRTVWWLSLPRIRRFRGLFARRPRLYLSADRPTPSH
jgi:MoaA/NifB/PqqE/SkfB family radical SAM enzyme